MAASQHSKKRSRQRGFTLLETLAAIAILTIGLLAMAALMSRMTTNSASSRYMSGASVLATEKLEELSRYPASDPMVTVTSGSVGSLTSDSTNGNIRYYDDVQLSAMSGAITSTSSDSSGNYNSIVHQADGTITTSSSTTAPAAQSASLLYHRRWTIEANTPIAGTRRVTVFVQLRNPPLPRPVIYQMSMVRP